MNNENASYSIFGKINVLIIIVGLLLIVFGFIAMSGGGTKDPNVFAGDTLFDFRRLSLSTILILLGFAFEIVGILYRRKEKE
ncbi:MAG: hypothetical protein Fur0028_14680 [Bacteroidales bacterium]|jgi:hypothetical protein|nr:DUF3098 domain-containing protein [Bacteroidales bacterium]HNV95132.1 DUF3098 domain-containing protein [Bacteroidales bacterium]HOU97419.1 DUF3098 domain-containing protein [Bacteroidales bacterium]